MNNTDLKAAITEFGNKLDYIMLDNSEYILFQYPSNAKDSDNNFINKPVDPSDIIFKQLGSEDFFGVPYTDTMGSTIIRWYKWHKTDCIQAIGTVDDEYSNFRIHPKNFIR